MARNKPPKLDEVAYAAFLTRVEVVLLEKNLQDQFRDNGVFNVEYQYRKSAPVPEKDPHLFVKWSPGGVSGGSYMGGRNHYYTESDPPPELTSLDVVLEAIKPDLTFLAYKRLTASLYKTETWTENEYYGNSTDYTVKAVRLLDLFKWMSSEGWLS